MVGPPSLGENPEVAVFVFSRRETEMSMIANYTNNNKGKVGLFTLVAILILLGIAFLMLFIFNFKYFFK